MRTWLSKELFSVGNYLIKHRVVFADSSPIRECDTTPEVIGETIHVPYHNEVKLHHPTVLVNSIANRQRRQALKKHK